MPVKIYVPVDGRAEVVRQLLEAAEKSGLGPQHVRTEKTRGYGYIVSDELAKFLGVDEDSDAADVKKLDTTSDTKESDDADKSDKPKRGRPAGSKGKGASDGE